MVKITVTVWLILLAAPVFPATAKTVGVPFTTNPDGLVMLAVNLGQGVHAQVIFDTGAGLDVFAPSIVQKLHGKPAGQFTGFRENGERIDLPLYIIPELEVGPVSKKNALVGTWTVFDDLHLDGIISVNDFRQQPFTFDFVNKTLFFESNTSLAHRHAIGFSSPLQFDDERGISLDLYSQFLIGDQLAQCGLDTGSPSLIISTRYMDPLGINKDDKKVIKHESKNLAGVAIVRYDAYVPRIALAAAPQIKQSNAEASFSDIIYDCEVGIGFWSGKALTIDIPHRQLIVGNPASARK